MSSDNTNSEKNKPLIISNIFEWEYYAYYRIPVIIHNKIIRNYGKSTIQGRGIGKVFAEYKDNLVVIDGENKKEREYLVAKRKIARYDGKQIYLNISGDSLKELYKFSNCRIAMLWNEKIWSNAKSYSIHFN
jgi:hypothetical protein